MASYWGSHWADEMVDRSVVPMEMQTVVWTAGQMVHQMGLHWAGHWACDSARLMAVLTASRLGCRKVVHLVDRTVDQTAYKMAALSVVMTVSHSVDPMAVHLGHQRVHVTACRSENLMGCGLDLHLAVLSVVHLGKR